MFWYSNAHCEALGFVISQDSRPCNLHRLLSPCSHDRGPTPGAGGEPHPR
jgi:hypothetical protein